MSLSWDATEVADFENLTDNELVTRDSLIWATIPVGINNLTQERVDDFFARVSFIEKTQGTYRHDSKGSLPFTREDVQRFVGLRTNASPKTEAAFRKDAFDNYKRWL